MTESTVQRKARGAFFTPPAITRFLADWAVRSASDRVLEPSCGEAEFLLAAGARIRDRGAGLFAGETLHGIELHAPSAEIATQRVQGAGFIADIFVSDFFDVPASRDYDAVIGNPPYVRYQDFTGEARAKALRAALEDGVRLNGLASSWAAFVVHAARFLREGGRLALVLPGELLSVKYAAEVRRFLLRRFGSVKLVMFEELVFPGVQEEVVLLLAEGTGPASVFEVYQARDANDLPRVEHAAWTTFTPGADANHADALHLNSLYGVRLRKERRRLGMDLLPVAAVNSVTLLGSELVGRAYGGGRSPESATEGVRRAPERSAPPRRRARGPDPTLPTARAGRRGDRQASGSTAGAVRPEDRSRIGAEWRALMSCCTRRCVSWARSRGTKPSRSGCG